MSLLNAPEYDEKRAKRRVALMVTGVIVLVMLLAAAWFLRNWTYEHEVDKFFTQIEQKDYEGAFTIFTADPDWKAHPEKYKVYPFGQFTLDWGPSGEWGAITSHHIDCAARTGSGVIVRVTVNNRPEPAYIWVEKKDHTLGVAPSHLQLQCGNMFAR
jgi:hypothetical protein